MWRGVTSQRYRRSEAQGVERQVSSRMTGHTVNTEDTAWSACARAHVRCQREGGYLGRHVAYGEQKEKGTKGRRHKQRAR